MLLFAQPWNQQIYGSENVKKVYNWKRDLKMGIYNYEGNTYVAFVDISGFKNMMKDKERVANVVYEFYQSGYKVLDKLRLGEEAQVQGIFVSDCGILFVNREHEEIDEGLQLKRESLNLILEVIKDINLAMIKDDVMLTSSIAYGSLKCTEKLEFHGISKNPFYGDAYLNAFMDNEKSQKKIHPGQCRIVKKTLPKNVIRKGSISNYEHFNLLKTSKDRNHYYFYWMLNNKSEMSKFDKSYSNLESEKYNRMTKLIKGYIPNK